MFQHEPQGAVNVISPAVPLNQEHAHKLLDTLKSVLGHGQPLVVLDLTNVPLIDSAGLDAMLDARDLVSQRGGTLKLAAISQLGEDILRATRVGDRFDRYTNVKAAVGSFVR